jgi:hypothetical protein
MTEKVKRQKYSDKEQLDAWMEWKEKCQLTKTKDNDREVSNKNREILIYKGEILYKNLMQRWNFSYSEMKDKQLGFSYLEFHALNHRYTTKSPEDLAGKTYKDGIFYKIDNSSEPPLKVINGICKSYIKTAVNQIFAGDIKEKKNTKKSSLQTIMFDNGATLEDFIPEYQPDAGEETALKETIELAQKEAAIIVNHLTFEEKVLLVSDKYLKRSDKFLLQFLNTNTSHITDVLNKNIPKKVKKYLKKNGYSNDSFFWLVKFIIASLKKELFSLLKSEKPALPILKYIEKFNKKEI